MRNLFPYDEEKYLKSQIFTFCVTELTFDGSDGKHEHSLSVMKNTKSV